MYARVKQYIHSRTHPRTRTLIRTLLLHCVVLLPRPKIPFSIACIARRLTLEFGDEICKARAGPRTKNVISIKVVTNLFA